MHVKEHIQVWVCKDAYIWHWHLSIHAPAELSSRIAKIKFFEKKKKKKQLASCTHTDQNLNTQVRAKCLNFWAIQTLFLKK